MRLERAVLLAMHFAARPKHVAEQIPSEEMAALMKLIAEALLEERKTILGWYFDFRSMLVSLPENNFVAWSDALKDILERGESSAKELEVNIG